MPFTDLIILILLATVPILCAVGLVAVSLARISRMLVHIGQRLDQMNDPGGSMRPRGESSEGVDSGGGGAFEDFLHEDPARRRLPKREQFAAYRLWRQEKGLNWSQS